MRLMYWSDVLVGKRNRFYSIGVFWGILLEYCRVVSLYLSVVVVSCVWVVVLVSCGSGGKLCLGNTPP